MKPQYIAMAGLLIDIAGGFLLAVEAIKITNLIILKDKYLNKLGNYHPGDKIFTKQITRSATNINVIAVRAELLIGFLTLFLIDIITNNYLVDFYFKILSNLNVYISIPLLLITIPIVFLFSVKLGNLIVIFAAKVALFLIQILNYIEINTSKGIIGIIGFLLLFFGFIMQFISTCMTL